MKNNPIKAALLKKKPPDSPLYIHSTVFYRSLQTCKFKENRTNTSIEVNRRAKLPGK